MKLNGYRASHKNKWFLIRREILTIQEFTLLEYYLDNMYFDKENKDKFGMFETFPQEIAIVFNKKGTKTIEAWHNGLVNKGFIEIADPLRQLYTVKNPLRYVVGLEKWRGEASKYSHEEANKTEEDILDNMQFFPKNREKFPTNTDSPILKDKKYDPNSLSSFKDTYPITSKQFTYNKESGTSSLKECESLYKDNDPIEVKSDSMEMTELHQLFNNSPKTTTEAKLTTSQPGLSPLVFLRDRYNTIVKEEKSICNLISQPSSNAKIKWQIQEQQRLSKQIEYCEGRIEQEESIEALSEPKYIF